MYPSLFPSIPGNHNSTFWLYECYYIFLVPCVNGIIKYFILLFLVYFTSHDIFKCHPCSTCQNSLPCSHWMTVHSECTCTTFCLCIYPLMGTGIFHRLAIVNDVAMIMAVQVSVQVPTINSSGYIPRSRISGSYDNSKHNCLRSCHTVFHSSYTFSIPTCSAVHKGTYCSTSSSELLSSGPFSFYQNINLLPSSLLTASDFIVFCLRAFPQR